MNRYKDIFATKGIGTIFEENYAEDFAAFFGDNTAENVDLLTLARYGEKPLIYSITDVTASKVVCAIIALNIDAWRRIHKAITAQYDPVLGASEEHTKTGDIVRENIDANTTINSEKAFNDNEFVGDTQNATNGTFNGTETYDIKETRQNIDGNTAERLGKEITMRNRYNLQKQIIETIINELTILIY